MNVSATIRGPLFSKKIDKTVQDAIVDQVFNKLGERVTRSSRRLGRKNNRITSENRALVLDLTSTLRNPADRRQSIPSFGRGAGRRKNPDFNPRVKGTAWVKFVYSLAKGSFMRNQLRSAAAKITAELG